jgi:hypothetical protein
VSSVGFVVLVLAGGRALDRHRAVAWRPILPAAPDWTVTATMNRVLFDGESARKIWPWPDGDQTDFWTPTMADVVALEEQLPGFLRRELAQGLWREFSPSPDDSPLSQKALSYHRQYAGVMNHRRPVIEGNFFCTDVERDWHKEFVDVMGGGDCFFGIKYDAKERRLFGLWINAPK